jgi:hypothetical protein
MHDLPEPFRRHLFGGRCTGVGKHAYDFAAEALFIELERCFALAVEHQVSAKSHRALLGVKDDVATAPSMLDRVAVFQIHTSNGGQSAGQPYRMVYHNRVFLPARAVFAAFSRLAASKGSNKSAGAST